MNQKHLTFQAQKLQVDFLTFSIKPETVDEISTYFFERHGFNSCLSQGKTKNYEDLYYNENTKPTLKFRVDFWGKTLLELVGLNAAEFYKLVKTNSIDLKIFEGASISRFDLCLDLKIDEFFDEVEFDRFLIEMRQKILTSEQLKTKHVKLVTREKGSLLGINRRSNSNYYRIYMKQSCVRFELELKRSSLRDANQHFFTPDFNKFEQCLTKFFFKYSNSLFQSDSKYLSWLNNFNRKYTLAQKMKKKSKSLVFSEYLSNREILYQDEPNESFYTLLQFLSYIQTLDKSKSPVHQLEGKNYHIQKFFIKDFMDFSGIPSSNWKRRGKLVVYFQELLSNLFYIRPVVEHFEDESFRIFATIIYSDARKINNRWVGVVYVIEDLYSYRYPFLLSESFRNYTSCTDCFLKLKIIQVITANSQKKTFNMPQFIGQLNLSNKAIQQVKNTFISLLHEIHESGIIHNNIELVSKAGYTNSCNVDKLTIKKLRSIEYVILYEQ